MDRARFYAYLRRAQSGVFGTSLSQGQVDGLERLLDTWEKYYAADPVEWLAYNLATSYHETARTMQPITERGKRSYFDRYEPETEIGKRLGNTLKGDGYRYRGQGDVQNTGRANAQKATKRLNEVFNLKIDLVQNPDLRGDPFISAHSLFLGNKEGWWTGRKLGDYITPHGSDFVAARRVVNGTDRAVMIAGYAKAFLAAIVEAGGVPVKAAEKPASAPTAPKPATRAPGAIAGLIAGLIRFIVSLLPKGKTK